MDDLVWGLSDDDYNRTTLLVSRVEALVRALESTCEAMGETDVPDLLSLLGDELKSVVELLSKARPAHFEKEAGHG